MQAIEAARIYDGFIGLEERSAELYLEVSVAFYDHHPDLRWFWVDMGMGEKQHAHMLQHCRKAGVASEPPGKDQIRSLNTLFQELEERVSAPDLTVDDAFDMAIQLESSEINDTAG